MTENEMFNLVVNTIIKEAFHKGPVPVRLPGDGTFCINENANGWKWIGGMDQETGKFLIEIKSNTNSNEPGHGLFGKTPAYVGNPQEIIDQIKFMAKMFDEVE